MFSSARLLSDGFPSQLSFKSVCLFSVLSLAVPDSTSPKQDVVLEEREVSFSADDALVIDRAIFDVFGYTRGAPCNTGFISPASFPVLRPLLAFLCTLGGESFSEQAASGVILNSPFSVSDLSLLYSSLGSLGVFRLVISSGAINL